MLRWMLPLSEATRCDGDCCAAGSGQTRRPALRFRAARKVGAPSTRRIATPPGSSDCRSDRSPMPSESTVSPHSAFCSPRWRSSSRASSPTGGRICERRERRARVSRDAARCSDPLAVPARPDGPRLSQLAVATAARRNSSQRDPRRRVGAPPRRSHALTVRDGRDIRPGPLQCLGWGADPCVRRRDRAGGVSGTVLFATGPACRRRRYTAARWAQRVVDELSFELLEGAGERLVQAHFDASVRWRPGCRRPLVPSTQDVRRGIPAAERAPSSAIATTRRISFASSRMFPGQSYRRSAAMKSSPSRRPVRPNSFACRARNSAASAGISSFRSRSGGSARAAPIR